MEEQNSTSKFQYYVGIKFHHSTHAYFFGFSDLNIQIGDKVVVETTHGPELGEVCFEPISISQYKSVLELKPILRKATDVDIKLHDINLKDAEVALEICRNEVKRINLDMNLISCEYTLDKGKVIFNGDVEEGTAKYLSTRNYCDSVINLEEIPREPRFESGLAKMCRLEIKKDNNVFELNDNLKGKLIIKSFETIESVILKITLCHNAQAVITAESEVPSKLIKSDQMVLSFEFSLEGLAPATYTTKIVLCKRDGFGNEFFVDVLLDSYFFKVVEPNGFQGNKRWNPLYSGYFIGKELKLYCD